MISYTYIISFLQLILNKIFRIRKSILQKNVHPSCIKIFRLQKEQKPVWKARNTFHLTSVNSSLGLFYFFKRIIYRQTFSFFRFLRKWFPRRCMLGPRKESVIAHLIIILNKNLRLFKFSRRWNNKKVSTARTASQTKRCKEVSQGSYNVKARILVRIICIQQFPSCRGEEDVNWIFPFHLGGGVKRT